MRLIELPRHKLEEVRGVMERFLYRVRYNIAFYKASRSGEYARFHDAISDAIRQQILVYATREKVEELAKVEKAVQQLTDEGILDKLEPYWIPLLSIIEEEELDRFYKWAGEFGGNVALDKLGIDDDFVLTSEDVLDGLMDRKDFLVDTVDESTRSWIARTIEDAKKRDVSPTAVARLFRDVADRRGELRADKIAETETMWAMNYVEWLTYKKNGVTEKYWVTTYDERTCEICQANEAVGWIGIDEKFPSGDLHPLAHVLCRCFLKIRDSNYGNNPWHGS